MIILPLLEGVVVNPNIPGVNPGSDPVSQIANFYQLSLLAAGLLAFGIIIYAAIQYTISAGSPSAQSDAKDQILQAFIGIFLLFAAYLILSTINPELTLLKLPELVGLKTPPPPPPGGGGGPPGGSGQCASGACQSLQAAGLSCKNSNSCSADAKIIATLQCVSEKSGVAFTVTEAMPPTVPHLSRCHNNGCCVDVKVTNFTSCAQVTAIMNAVSACGTTAANEYAIAGCPGSHSYETTTGDNIHINAPGCG